MKIRNSSLKLSFLPLVLAAAASVCRAADVPQTNNVRKPNIVFILADDLGWMDTSLYGSKYYRTPHIDALAKRGMMFTRAYTANPLCSPTRASLLTGVDPARLGFTAPAGHVAQVK